MEQKGGSPEQLANGVLVGDRLTSARLAEALLYLGEETKPSDRIFQRGIVGQPFDDLKNLLLGGLSTQSRHPFV